ncbi:hypothetical protein [Leptolinea tardivitalis]|uniref:hypothetical protein n=1 Tax=Leptolinea tardivitalis TaxID=229920 RepID=UPI00111231EB|nr:hypothetical protein [Leptolinea tardivitalis]
MEDSVERITVIKRNKQINKGTRIPIRIPMRVAERPKNAPLSDGRLIKNREAINPSTKPRKRKIIANIFEGMYVGFVSIDTWDYKQEIPLYNGTKCREIFYRAQKTYYESFAYLKEDEFSWS